MQAGPMLRPAVSSTYELVYCVVQATADQGRCNDLLIRVTHSTKTAQTIVQNLDDFPS